MADTLVGIVEAYFAALRDAHSIAAGTKERSYYPALSELFNAIGSELKPRVLCLSDLGNVGAGHPDFGLFAANQVQKGEPRKGQMPERGVIEVKSVGDEAWRTADTAQVTKYFGSYRLVIVSNLREFLIVGEGPDGRAIKLESFKIADSAQSFWKVVNTPRKSAELVGRGLGEYLKRALTQSVSLREPKHVAWFLASYARDGLARVERAGDLPALSNIRTSLEEALGVKFEAKEGEHFFRSTLVQTLFYGVFSAWVLWAREAPRSTARFDWHAAIWHLTVPFIRTLFQQLASPERLQPLGLVEVLDWTGATLNRIDTAAFFKRFNDADAVQFFYEPFLEAFDPALRRELGVWYTPNEVVTYMVARVDKALRDDLGISDGLASDRVLVLDPCCGTGAFLAAVLRHIDSNFAERGLGDLRAEMVKKAALSRIFGFEIMPAPFVVAHLQVGLVLQKLGVTLKPDSERAGVYLTNALTGWEPVAAKPMPFPEFEEERKKASEIKQGAPILVIVGNPPYNGFAGMAVDEERSLTDAYRATKIVRRPEGGGLNDLYVRFFRMAERRIVKVIEDNDSDPSGDVTYSETGEGIICFISNYSWLDGSSFTGMRERYLEAFDAVRIDSLNGDKFRTGKTTPQGTPDPSIFSGEQNPQGIQVGTAIATLVRKKTHVASSEVEVRQLWGTKKRQQLLDTAQVAPEKLYTRFTPPLKLGLPFVGGTVGASYFEWPKLSELIPVSFPGVKTSRDEFLVSIDRESLEKRLSIYFDHNVSNEDLKVRFPLIMRPSGRYDDPTGTRELLLKRGRNAGRVTRYTYRPFDLRWVYWESETKLLDEKREDYFDARAENLPEMVIPKAQRKKWSPPLLSSALLDLNAMDGGASAIPSFIKDALHPGNLARNLSGRLEKDASRESSDTEHVLFDHCLAILHSPLYFAEQGGAMRSDQPRIPIPTDILQLHESANLGAALGKLLDVSRSAPGITIGGLRPGLKALGLPKKAGNGSLVASDLALTVGWGHTQLKKKTGTIVVMPGAGMVRERGYTEDELFAFDAEARLKVDGKTIGLSAQEIVEILGERTLDVHLNPLAWWTNVPLSVWNYSLGGYPVIKKWLSYREQSVLGRAITPDEMVYVSEMIRRIAAILLMRPALDRNYSRTKMTAAVWNVAGLSPNGENSESSEVD